MKRTLTIVAAALAGAAFAGPAAAELTMSGSMKQSIGAGDYRGGAESEAGIHFDTDAQIDFTATGTTDGGVAVTARIGLEGQSGGDQIDENWLALEGAFGKVVLGGEDSAAISHGYAGIGGGYAGMGYYDGGDDYTPYAGAAYPIGYGDNQGIRYSTPAIGGFSAGISYQPDSSAEDASGTDNDDNIVALGANFTSDMGGSSFTLAAAFLSADSGDAQYGIGASVGFGASSLHLRYDARPADSGDTTSYGIGFDHALGAMKVGVGFGTVTTENATTTKTGPVDKTASQVSFGMGYDLGGGVKLEAAIAVGTVEERAERPRGNHPRRRGDPVRRRHADGRDGHRRNGGLPDDGLRDRRHGRNAHHGIGHRRHGWHLRNPRDHRRRPVNRLDVE